MKSFSEIMIVNSLNNCTPISKYQQLCTYTYIQSESEEISTSIKTDIKL